LLAFHIADGEGTGNAARGQMLQKAQKEGEVGLAHALLIECENERGLVRLQVEVRIFDAFCNALEAQGGADSILRKESLELIERDVGVDRHDGFARFPTKVRLSKVRAPRRAAPECCAEATKVKRRQRYDRSGKRTATAFDIPRGGRDRLAA